MSALYTAITFAPIQSFIEKSRKLRDLYGSSYILSYLSWSICRAAEQNGLTIISPALPNITQGMPNQIIIEGELPKNEAEAAFKAAWRAMVHACQFYIEEKIPAATYHWKREWKLWAAHSWEFFHATGAKIDVARAKLDDSKRSRDWTAINWVGESSTLSGADGIAWPGLGHRNPKSVSYRKQQAEVEAFYKSLNGVFGDSFIDPDEELSIPELIKRVVTYDEVAQAVMAALEKHTQLTLSAEDKKRFTEIAKELNPKSFKDLNRLKRKSSRSENDGDKQHKTGWFLGDGDQAGKYLQSLATPAETTAFSAQMREWGSALYHSRSTYLPGQGRMIYAGGDDFLGVLYERDQEISAKTCFDWMSRFRKNIWNGDAISSQGMVNKGNQKKPITASVGFVWAFPNVPQRDVLQHCRTAEQAAKKGGRDRIAFRILFNGGTHLEWICPWWILEEGHIDISQNTLGLGESQAWIHFYNDIAALESRHAFGAQKTDQTDIAKAIFARFFGENNPALNSEYWWNAAKGNPNSKHSGLLGNPSRYTQQLPTASKGYESLNARPVVSAAINNWVINLSKVGFHLARPEKEAEREPSLSQPLAA